MGTTYHHHPSHFPSKRIISWAIYALMLLAVLHFYFFPVPHNQSSLTTPPHPPQREKDTLYNPIPSSQSATPKPHTHGIISDPPAPSSPQGAQGQREEGHGSRCDYSDGRWVQDPQRGPRYNGTSCGTIKEGQNCMAHGRPDAGYLYWRWQPKRCKLQAFDATEFLELTRDKHLAFVGDSMARNQLESLLCLLAAASPPQLVYREGEENKFRRWTFPSHNATVSVFWSPFLVKGTEKSAPSGPLAYNKLYLDAADERWASGLREFDTVVFSVGHWFLHPAVYHEGEDATVLGCHHCPGLNHTEVGFFDVFRKAIRTALKEVRGRQYGSPPDPSPDKLVVVATFSPAHFEGEWDKFGACAKQEPYKEGEKEMEYMDAEMRKIEVEEVAAAMAETKSSGLMTLRIEALDVTRLALMRPDGHPGPYMYPNPFADGMKERVQNDCVHWCLPGPIDTWNEILLEMMKRWRAERRPST